ncbi:MAG: hypothetical protein ABI877_19675, partial [Gemmatimonadaceae bacterium]
SNAAQVAAKSYSKPDVEYAEPFTILDGVREMKDGRVIVVDPREKTVQIVDLKAGSGTKLGREGAGPGEYGFPQRALPLPGDSTAISDVLNQRMLVIEPNGKVGGFLETPSAGGGRGGMIMMGMLPRQSDGRGGLYYSTPGVVMTDQGPKTSDSSAIVRWRPAMKKVDTVAFLALPKGAAQVSGSRGNMNVRLGGNSPFAAADAFAVAPDGRVAVLRVADYHVDWVSPGGQKTVGAPIAFEHLKVSAAHKEEYKESRKNAFGMQVTMNNGQRSAQMVPARAGDEPIEWPESMPPFLADPALVAPNGQLWVLRTTKAGEAPMYDVIDGSGKLVQRVVAPKRTRVIGFGTGVVYMARRDDDDLQYLQRYRLQ